MELPASGQAVGPVLLEGTMRTNVLRATGAVVASLGALFGTVAVAGAAPVSHGEADAATTVVYKGARIQVAISCLYARYHPEGKWLMLDAEMTAHGGPIGIPRGNIAVRTPSGDVFPLATQQAFEQGYPQLVSPIKKANFLREHLSYFMPEPFRPLNLFRLHGVGWVWQDAWLDPFHNSYGRLYFHLPNGVHNGHYQLLIQLPKEEVVIPFTI
jgi:hypothetical protein